MCMKLNLAATERMRARLAEGSLQFYKCYKVVFSDPRSLHAPYRNVPIKVESGVIRSNRENVALTESELESNDVHVGIHVFLEEASAEAAAQSDEYIVVPVLVEAEDLVGCDEAENHSVFMKVKVDETALQKLIAEASEDDDDEYDDDDDDDDDDDWDDDDYEDEDDEDECPYCGDPDCFGECEEEDDEDEDD